LDPSCSGSGIISRLDHLVDDEDESKFTTLFLCDIHPHLFLLDDGKDNNGQTQEERLKNLSEFQISIIEHAMKCKPSIKVI
jgi:putative methyltransferase